MNGTDKLLKSLNAAVDANGLVDCNVTLLCSWTGLSRASIFRSMEQLTRDGQIETTAKRGPAGGLRIRLINVSPKVSKLVSQRSQNRSVRDVSTQAPGPSALGGLLRETNSELVSSETNSAAPAEWFVSCNWYDANLNMWCHGDDGTPTYIPCASKEVAITLAMEHRRTPHRGLPSLPAVTPNVDVCRQMGRGKILHFRFDDFTPDYMEPLALEPAESKEHSRRIRRGERP